jgi:hypothetical protein
MATYQITAPNGSKYRLTGPENATQDDLVNALLAQHPDAGQAPAAPAAPKEGIMAALAGGAKRFGSTIETGLESAIDPNLAAQRGVARSQALGQEYAPGASLEKVKQAYAEKGLFPAAYEAISQIPTAISENVPNIAATLAGGRTGAMAGSAFGPVGALVGGGIGAVAPSLLQLYGSGLERQAQEGSKDVSRTAALGAAIPGAAAEVVSTYIPLGRTFIGKLLGPEAEKALARGTNQGLETAAKESVMATLAKGTAIGAGVEIPTEVGQQMLERLQAGLPLTTPDALKEYGESAYGAALVGGPFGAAARAAGRPGAREQYQALKQKEEQAAFDAERKAALDKFAAEEAEAEKQRGITREQLGEGSNLLALPAPSKEVKPTDETRELINPVGDITREELAPEVTKYIDTYRKDNGLPRLKSYTVEDVKDAMTQVNPKGERAALDSILTAKTGYTGEERYTAENVLDAAVEKNVATETKGFNDFLARVTGTNTLEGMTQPQLFAAFKALKDMKREDTTQQLVLPEGSNASRYTQRQYDQALDYVRSTFEESGNKPLSTETILTDIKDSTKLETERDAMALLDAAIKNEDLSQSREVVFRTYREGQARPVATYRDKAKAQAAAKKQGLNVKEEALVQVAPAEQKVAPETKRAPLPTGYDIKESLLDSGTAPAEFEITPEGRGKRLTAVPTEGEATEKIPKLQALRAQRAAQMDANIAKSEGAIAKGQAQLDRLEADGKGDSEQYKILQAKQASRVKTMNSRIELFKRQKEEFLAPLKSKAAGQKTLTRQAFTVSKDGKTVGSFPSRKAAEESILTNLPDEELAKVASDTRFGGITDRAVREQERRKEGKTGIEVKGTAEGLEKAGVQTTELKEKLKVLQDKLTPMLAKFGLKDVALNVVRSIEKNAEGSYIDKLIKIAIDAEKPIRTMRHEALHALKELGFFTPEQWKALEKQAKNVWIDKYLGGQMAKVGDKVMTRLEAYKQMGLSEAEIIEEAIADAFGDFDTAGKAPPGMLQALFKRMQQFFTALRQALGGAGFESAEDIFGKIERGELAPKSIGETMGERLSLLRAANPDEVEISTQNPQGKKRIYDPITEMLSIDEAAVREAMKANPDMAKRTIQAIKAYGFVPNGTPNNKVLEVFKQNIVNNLMFLYKSVPERIRQRSKLWYDGANKIATEMADQFDVSMPQVAGIMAAMSPQKDWFQNVSMAERALDILTKHGNEAWDENMLKYANSYVKESSDRKEREKRQDAFEKIKAVAAKGTKLKDMDVKEAAAFIRAYDEAYHSRNYRIVTPEGGFGDLVRNLDGKPATMMWSTYGPIEKTVSIFRDGSRSNISQQLGFEHKIRSFYNNIAAPNSDISHVTIDTHAVAAGLFEALAGTDPEVAQNFGATGSSDVIGVGGTYGLIADAYREAAQKAGIRAREMQSITWEAVRGLFSEEMKSSIKPKVRAEWAKYKEGKQSFEDTREKVIEIAGGITDPDWVGSGTGKFVADGAASYDKSFVPEGGVRLREAKDIREKLTFNLSAVTNSIPGLRELYQRAMGKDKEAYTVLQKVAESSLTHMLSGTNARVNIEYAKGVYLSDREPSISVQISFDEGESKQVMAALANFAESYNQQQIHVRQPTIRKVGHEFDDGSYATVVYEIPLKKELSNVRISEIIDQSGLAGFTVTPETLTAYWVKSDGNDESNFDSFAEQVAQVHELVGAKGVRPRRTVERLYVYGEGYGARIPYAEIEGQLRIKQSSDTRTPKIIAEYLTGEPVTAFKQKPLTQTQTKDQELLAEVFDELPTNDLKKPLVKKAYKALANALEEQYKVLPIKVVLVDSSTEPYANSAEMREDVSKRNRFRVYKTTPETFGPPGSDFRGHPLLQDSGLTDVNGTPMLYNDLLRAVHDYFAHNLSETEFGPRGEMAAWRNHMAITNDPLARWALTVETRAQNAWQNFRSGVQDLTLMQRGFADQKAALPPVNFVLTGDAKVDQPMIDYIGTLTPAEKLGSLKQDSALAKSVEKNMPKFSLRTYFPTAEEAEAAAYEKAPPSTAAFKRFFGASKVMEEGRPQVMFHGSPDIFETFNDSKPIFVTPDPSFAEEFGRDRSKDLGRDPDEAKVYPLWVRAETPFDYENPEHVQMVAGKIIADQKLAGPNSTVRLKQSSPTVSTFQDEVADGLWSVIEDPVFQAALKELGFDSFNVQEGGNKNLAVFNANQVKSVTGNIGEFGENKNIKYSLPPISSGAEDRVNTTTTVREQDGFVGRMLQAISPESRSYFRQQALNRYNQLGVYDKKLAEKMGGAALLADQSAESAALMSDLGAGITASAMGFGNRMGGIPVYKNGVTTVINSGDQKGLIASLAPLAKYNDPKVYQYYQYWAAVKRGERLYAEGREQLIQPGDRKYADELLQKFPEFEQVQKDFNKFNEGLVQYMVDTGVLSEAQGKEYIKHADYVPFYRQLNEEKTIGPNIFQSISGVKQPRKLKGGEAPLADFLETVVRNTQASIQAGIKNTAAQRAVNVAMQLGADVGVERLTTVSSAPDTVTVLEKGKQVTYRVADPLFISAIKSLNIPELPFMTLLSAPSNTLRNLVTKDPGFMMANLMRDSLSAWVTSGQNIKPIIGTVQNFAKALAGRSPGLEALLNAGVVGGYEFSNVVEASAEELAKDMRRKYGSSTTTEKVLRPFTWVWEALEKGTEASDAATRIAVYERVMEETGNEAEALYRALEVMNFNRKGSSAVVRILTAAVPFLNARMQGLDVFYRASFGQMATADAKAIQKAFWVRGMTMMALSSMYFFAVSDDEEYKKQEAETKDNYWIIPGVGKFPTPFEVGVLFKTIPERILAYSFKDDTGQDFKKSIQRALVNTFAFNPIPQTVKPIIEASTNYSFFTMRPIVGQGMEKVAPEFQVGPGTSKLAEMIGTELGLSPIKIDSIIRGYTGTIGMYGVQAIDAVLNANSDSPNASKRFEQLPVIKRFALDPEARGNITQYYELKNAVDSLAATSSLLEKSMKPDEWTEYMRENKGLFATTEYVRDLEKEMKELREMRRLVQTGPFSADSKRDYLTTIGQAENNLTKNIQTVKKLIASYQ